MSKKAIIIIVISVLAVAGAVYYFFFKKGFANIGQPGYGKAYTGDISTLPTEYTFKAKKGMALGYYVPYTADTFGQQVPYILDWMWEITKEPTSWGNKYKSNMVELAEHAAYQRAVQVGDQVPSSGTATGTGVKPANGATYYYDNNGTKIYY
jgi:hypothetical protein